jgi:RNA polymerase sigma-70 factor (ECF subfamily)
MKSTDSDIIRRVIGGDSRAFAELIDRHKGRAMTLAVRLLKDHHEAEEALQDAFVRAYRALPAFEWKSSFSTWFYRIVFNVCASRLSRRGDTMLLSIDRENEDEFKLEVPSQDDEPDKEMEKKEFSRIVRAEIGKMDASYASILTMFFLQEMSYDEIISVTGLPLGTVKNRLFRARMQLRTAVVRQFSEKKPKVNI